ncbi:MAG: hypothetical protein HXK96_01020 [Candidatus Nanogingivalaceae bacterium]|nr:hypothetical protein [Candidatus Nanogingivalaceae bacterium]
MNSKIVVEYQVNRTIRSHFLERGGKMPTNDNDATFGMGQGEGSGGDRSW